MVSQPNPNSPASMINLNKSWLFSPFKLSLGWWKNLSSFREGFSICVSRAAYYTLGSSKSGGLLLFVYYTLRIVGLVLFIEGKSGRSWRALVSADSIIFGLIWAMNWSFCAFWKSFSRCLWREDTAFLHKTCLTDFHLFRDLHNFLGNNYFTNDRNIKSAVSSMNMNFRYK